MNAKQHRAEQIAELGKLYKDTLDRGHGIITRFEQGVRAGEAILAAGYRKPRTITTAEELDALPEGSVTRDRTGDVQKRTYAGWIATGEEEPNYVGLPAIVIYEPEAAQ